MQEETIDRVGSHELPDWLKTGIQQLKEEDKSRETLESARNKINSANSTERGKTKFRYFRKPRVPRELSTVEGQIPAFSYPAHLMPTDLVSLVDFFGKLYF